MADPISIIVNGASGRMGLAVLRAALTQSDAHVVSAWVRSGSPHAGKPIATLAHGVDTDLKFTETFSTPADVLIDFSSAPAFDACLAIAIEHQIAFISGTTGLTEAQHAALREAAKTIPVLWSANFSLGVAMLTRLARGAAHALPEWDCEISEAHHRSKLDAPSGTALSLGRAIAEARDSSLSELAVYARKSGSPARREGEIGFSVVRGGDIVGEHTVLLIGQGERIELTHSAQSRDIFASGAVRAALWLARRSAGFYTIENVLGLSG